MNAIKVYQRFRPANVNDEPVDEYVGNGLELSNHLQDEILASDADENTNFECKNKGRRQTWALAQITRG